MNSPAWALFDEISPDIALLQEVGGIPITVAAEYQSAMREAAGNRFNTAILVRGTIGAPVPLTSARGMGQPETRTLQGQPARVQHHRSGPSVSRDVCVQPGLAG